MQGATACRSVQPNVNVTSAAVPIEIEIEGSISSTSTPPHLPAEDPPPTHSQEQGSTLPDDNLDSALAPPLYASIDEVPNEILADTIALILEQFISRSKYHTSSHNVELPKANEPAALFFSPSKQTEFSLSFYIRRLVQYTCCSKSAFVVAVLYLARLSQNHPVFILSDLNVHRLICTSIVLAAKWLDDISYSNSHYARVAGVQTAAEMTRMENYFLKAIDFRLYVAPNNYRDVENSLLNIAASWS